MSHYPDGICYQCRAAPAMAGEHCPKCNTFQMFNGPDLPYVPPRDPSGPNDRFADSVKAMLSNYSATAHDPYEVIADRLHLGQCTADLHRAREEMTHLRRLLWLLVDRAGGEVTITPHMLQNFRTDCVLTVRSPAGGGIVIEAGLKP